jgi:hypothetical protein
MTVLAIVSMAFIANGCGKAPSAPTFTLHTSTSAN